MIPKTSLRNTCISSLAAVASLICGAISSTAMASEATPAPKSSVSVELKAGLESDSNVSVSEIDNVTNVGDVAALLEVGLAYQASLSSKTGLRLGYDFSQSAYQDFKAFDLQTHLAAVELTRKFGDIDTGVAYRYIHAALDGNAFLTMQQISPSASVMIGKKAMVRGAYTYSDKTFDGRPTRDAHNHAGTADLYYFFKGSDAYVSGGVKVARETAQDNQFSYASGGMKLRGVRRFTALGRKISTQLVWQGEDRKYKGITPAIAAARHDRRSVISASAEIALVSSVFAVISYETGVYTSNLASADYDQQVASLKVGTRF